MLEGIGSGGGSLECWRVMSVVEGLCRWRVWTVNHERYTTVSFSDVQEHQKSITSLLYGRW